MPVPFFMQGFYYNRNNTEIIRSFSYVRKKNS